MSKKLPVDVAVKMMEQFAEDIKEGFKGNALKGVAASACFIVRPGERDETGFIIQFGTIAIPLIDNALSKIQVTYESDPKRFSRLRDLLYRELLSRFLRTEKTLATITISIVAVSNTNPPCNFGEPGGATPAILSILDMPGEATQAEVDLIRFKLPTGDAERFSDVMSLKIEGFERSEDVSQGMRNAMQLNYVSVYEQAPLDVTEVYPYIDLDEVAGVVSREVRCAEAEIGGFALDPAPTLH